MRETIEDGIGEENSWRERERENKAVTATISARLL